MSREAPYSSFDLFIKLRRQDTRRGHRQTHTTHVRRTVALTADIKRPKMRLIEGRDGRGDLSHVLAGTFGKLSCLCRVRGGPDTCLPALWPCQRAGKQLL